MDIAGYTNIGYKTAYTKFGISMASNASVTTETKTPHFCKSGNEEYLLVEALTQSPQNTESLNGSSPD